MSDSLLFHSTIFCHLRKFLPDQDLRRLRSLAWAMTGLILEKTVNLPLWATVIASEAKAASRERRMRRLLENKHIEVRHYYEPFLRSALAAWAGRTIYLAIDTTTLAGRLTVIRVALIYRGRAIPIAWEVLTQKSTAVALEHYADLLRYVATLLPPKSRVVLLGDRGFRDTDLMALARELGWHFRLRLVKSEEVTFANGQHKHLAEIPLRRGQQRFFQRVRLTAQAYGPINLALTWDTDPEAEPWYIATDEQADASTLEGYALRMNLEEGVRDDKSGGFQLEDSRLDDPLVLSRLLLVMALSYLHLVSLGTIVVEEGLRHQVDTHWRRGLSYFQIGWRWLRHQLSQGLCPWIVFYLNPIPDPEPVVASAMARRIRSPTGAVASANC